VRPVIPAIPSVLSANRKVSGFHGADQSCEVGLWEVISALCIVICALQTIRLSNRVFSHSVMNRMTPFVC
jgi:hypothetical protein